MKTFGLQDGDLVFDKGDFTIIEGTQELQQCLQIMLSTNLGEWFLNEDFGFNYHLALEKPEDDEVQSEIARVLAQEERIETIGEITTKQDTRLRTLDVHYTVALVGGETITNEVNIHGSN
ncbi:DUF2634 domain-containing protein [Sporosarcina sp. P17b]|uniref:DUF2634 domain-containing protein n=1 Tax=Sporosarcina sp. P17b TaxID=2048260 RepID=UPI000C16E5AE|nr:DUF2634 domain-containing protein [Sporosarcina sp. P17b]PIC73348.1 DUF2634 domain-containing protein [Sporosarcina sp. P17b]